MKKAFTITELLVAIGLLVVVLAASGMIFHYSVDAQRTASATSEIMRNLRAITDQLNADFDGLCKEAFLGIYYERSNGVRADKIVFFSTGDFRTIRQYPDDIVVGNIAVIFYGQSDEIIDTNGLQICPDPCSSDEDDRKEKILARKQVILTSDDTLDDSNLNEPDNDEYKKSSLAKELAELLKYLPDTDKVAEVFEARWAERPTVNPTQEEDIPMFLARGVDNFTIQVDANDTNRIDPNGVLDWQPENEGDDVDKKHYPNAIKFTFTLYDSKGIIKGGREFTHIVYIGD